MSESKPGLRDIALSMAKLKTCNINQIKVHVQVFKGNSKYFREWWRLFRDNFLFRFILHLYFSALIPAHLNERTVFLICYIFKLNKVSFHFASNAVAGFIFGACL